MCTKNQNGGVLQLNLKNKLIEKEIEYVVARGKGWKLVGGRGRELNEGGQKVQTSSNKINKCFPCGSAGKKSFCNAEDLGSIPGLGRSPGEGKGYPLWYSDLENSMDCIVHGVATSRTRLSDFHCPVISTR